MPLILPIYVPIVSRGERSAASTRRPDPPPPAGRVICRFLRYVAPWSPSPHASLAGRPAALRDRDLRRRDRLRVGQARAALRRSAHRDARPPPRPPARGASPHSPALWD